MSETTMTDAVARRLPDFIRTLRINREKRRESVYASDNVYALLDALDAAEARVRELEAHISTIEAETIERCAAIADEVGQGADGNASRECAADEIAAAIRQLAQETKHEAE